MERRTPWINGPLSGGTGFTPGPRRAATPQGRRLAALLRALGGVHFPASRDEVLRALREGGEGEEWNPGQLPEGPFPNARSVQEAFRQRFPK